MDKIYWDQKHETLDLQAIRNSQLEKLKSLIRYVKKRSAYYRTTLKGVNVSALRTIDDVNVLPFTEPHEVIEHPFEFKCSEKTCRVHCSGGTVSSPKIGFFTSEDLDSICDLAARKLYMMGVRSNDRVALMQPFDIYLVGFGHLEAYKRIGAEVVPLGVRLEQDSVVALMKKLQPTVIDTVPSLILRLTHEVTRKTLSPIRDFTVRKIILAGEPITSGLKQFVENTWGAKVFNDYGLNELGIVAAECPERNGLHIAVDQYVVEIVEPWSGQAAKQGVPGELILTPLNLRGMPLIRYRTGDLVRVRNVGCSCGRTHPLVELIGRRDETLFIEGINLYAYQFDQALQEFAPEVLNYQLTYENIGEKDRLRFVCEAELAIDRDTLKSKAFEALKHVSIDFPEILEKSSIEVAIEVVEPLAISLTVRGKTKRFLDKRVGSQ